MATLEKIKICGIRSFGCDEEDVQTVRFQKPLTLILGENGCGKSTIIECLRYVTAQKEPAGKGTFVHDPGLVNRSTVKGFVKLRMSDIQGVTVDLCRQLQATKTKKSITTRSLDNVITRTNKETKERISISNRCADFTYEISRLFGVSRSVLENVIFCTQEDSHWPLDSDQKLKEKFDQIFDSDKYSKCINKVNDKKKKIKEAAKSSGIELKFLKQNKSMATEKRRRIKKTTQQVESCKNEIEGVNTSLEEVENKLKEINEKELNLSKNHTAMEMKKSELKGVRDLLKELKTRIKTPYDGTDEELKEEVKNFKKQLSVKQKEIEEQEEQIKQFNAEELTLSGRLMKEQGMLGQLLKEKELNAERVKQRDEEIISLAVKLNADVPSDRSENSIKNLLDDVKAKINDLEDELAKAKLFWEEEEQDLETKVDIAREDYLMFQNEISSKEKNLKIIQTQKEKIKQELSEVNRSATKLNHLESELLKLNEEIKNIQESADPENLRENVVKFIKERNKLEEYISEIEEQIKKLQQQSAVATELNVQKELKCNKDSQFRRLINKHEENLKTLLGDLPEAKFKMAVQNRFVTVRQKAKELGSVRAKKEKELTELEMKRKHFKETLKAKEDNIRAIEEDIYEICGSEDFEKTVELIQKELEELQDIKGTLSSSEFMYQRYIKALQKTQPCCPLCHRDFDQQNEVDSLVEELMGKIREVPTRLQENKNQLEEKQMKYNKMLELRSKYEQISSFREAEIPHLRSELENVGSLIKKVQKELSDVGNEINSLQSVEALCISLQNDVVLLDELQNERNQLEKHIERLRARLGTGEGDKEKLQKVLKQQDATRQSLKVARQKAEEFQSELNNYNEQLQIKQSLRNTLIEEINKIQGGTGKKNSLMERLEELEAEGAIQTAEINELETKCKSVKEKLETLVSQKKLEKTKNSEKIEKLTHKIDRLFKDLRDIEGHNKAIESHIRKGIDERIEAVEEVMKTIEKQVVELKAKKENIVKKMNFIKKGLSNHELMERDLEDNLRLREKTVEVEVLKKEVEALEAKFENTNFDVLLKEKRKLKGKEDELIKNKARIQGRVSEMEVQLEILQKDLLSENFKNVDEEYNDVYLKNELLKAIENDLSRYAATMEYAMMTYHQQQMKRVNAFIREYWRKVYQGNDIDYIEIRADRTENTEKKRNYNYKVIQVKSDVQLDMRNRCSAGQKMLASLIIRLALAETFSANCGILTLDEPTTNLDRKNIKNLARTLNEILMAKQNTASPNFQLIVITHDEEFLQDLMEFDIVSQYVNVDRNSRGITRINNKALTSQLNLSRANRVPQIYEYDYD